MDTVATLTKRNEGFAADRFEPSLRMLPTLKTIVVGCVDARVDPAQVLGLEPGETAMLRDVGGRVTPAALDKLAMFRTSCRRRRWLRADSRIAGAVLVTGLVYDVATGLVATVVGPERVATALVG